MKITLTKFGGMAPAIEPRVLSENLATVASNASFESGAVAPANVGTVPSTDFPYQTGDVRSILRPGNNATRLMFTSDTTGEAFASLLRPEDKWGRVYYTTVLGPRFTVEENYVSEGLKLNPVSYRLGVKTPEFQPTVGTPEITEEEGITADMVRVRYIFCFVDKYGHEGAPSAPSTIVELPTNLEFKVTLSFASEGLPDTNVTDAVRRIYRATFDGSISAWQFIADVPLAMASWDDTVALGEEGEELLSANWVPPPLLKQMVPVSSNFIAGFHEHYLCFSEAGLPHAWPEAYRFPLKYPIVGLKPTQNGLLVATAGKPYWAFGADPASAVPVEIDANYPCLSAKSLVDMGGTVMYATYDGLVAVSGQDAQVVSSVYIDRFTWLRDFDPTHIVAFAYEGRYVFSVGQTWWVFDLGEQGGFSTLTGIEVAPTDLHQAYYDAMRDTTVLLDKTGHCFDVVSMQGDRFVYRSKLFETPPICFAAARIVASQYPATLRVTADGDTHEYVTDSQKPFRLRGGFRARVWALEVEADGRVIEAAVAQGPEEFA